MKIARCVAVTLCLCATLTARAGARPASQDDPDLNPYALQDADGVPLSVTQPKQRELTEAELDENRKIAEAQKDWLLRSYLQIRAAKSGANQNDDAYEKLTSNKNLSRLSGLPFVEPTLSQQGTTVRTGADDSGRNAANLRGDPSQSNKGLPTSAPAPFTAFKPLIAPLGAADSTSMDDFYSSKPLPYAAPLFSSAPPAKPAPPPDTDENVDPTAIDTPGMVAAEKNNPLFDKDSGNLAFDLPASESLPESAVHQDKLALPLGTVPPPRSVAKTTTPPPPLKSLQLKFQEMPEPVKIPAPSPVRQPIGNPFDIFYR